MDKTELPIYSPFSIVPDCKLTEWGSEYMGKRNVTMDGKSCIPWVITAKEVDLSSLPDFENVDRLSCCVRVWPKRNRYVSLV